LTRTNFTNFVTDNEPITNMNMVLQVTTQEANVILFLGLQMDTYFNFKSYVSCQN